MSSQHSKQATATTNTEKSKKTKSSDPSGMTVFPGHPARQANHSHQVLTKKNLEWVAEDGKKYQPWPCDPLQRQGLKLAPLTHYSTSYLVIEASQLLNNRGKGGLDLRYMWTGAMWGVDNSKRLQCAHIASSKPTSDFSRNGGKQLTSSRLPFQANIILFLLLQRITSQINYLHPTPSLWLCFLGKAACNKHSSSSILIAIVLPLLLPLPLLCHPPSTRPGCHQCPARRLPLPTSPAPETSLRKPTVHPSTACAQATRPPQRNHWCETLFKSFIRKLSSLLTFSRREYLAQWLPWSQKLLVLFPSTPGDLLIKE